MSRSGRPSRRPGRSTTRRCLRTELTVEHVGCSARRHRQQLRFDPRRGADHVLDRHGLARPDPSRRIVGQLRDTPCRDSAPPAWPTPRHGLRATPWPGPGRSRPRRPWPETVLPETTGATSSISIRPATTHHSLHWRGREVVLPTRPLCLSSGLEFKASSAPYTHRSGRPNPTGTKRSPHRTAASAICQ